MSIGMRLLGSRLSSRFGLTSNGFSGPQCGAGMGLVDSDRLAVICIHVGFRFQSRSKRNYTSICDARQFFGNLLLQMHFKHQGADLQMIALVQ